MLLGGLRREHFYSSAARTIPVHWEDFHSLGVIPGHIGTRFFGVICGNMPEKHAFEYMCAIEVADLAALPAHVHRMRVPENHYAVFEHTAHVSSLSATWNAIWNEWLPRSGYTGVHAPDFEVYDERYNPKTGSGGIEIWYPVERPPVNPDG
jgi:AraC family transcriptional regulator